MDLLSFCRSHRLISNPFAQHPLDYSRPTNFAKQDFLNKVVIIILNPTSHSPSSSLPGRRPNSPSAGETSPSLPGSTGQALIQLSSGTSDTASPKRYDLSGSFGEPTHRSDRLATPGDREPRIGLDGSTYRSRSAYFCLDRFTLSDA